MRLDDGRLRYSATDLNHFLECEHLVQLDRKRALGDVVWEPPEDPERELVLEKGRQHESRYLASLKARGLTVSEIPPGPHAADATMWALRQGSDVIYQAAFASGGWRGYADFLYRVPGASHLGDYHYEVGDTKLASKPRPYFLLQLSFYSDHLAMLQGREPEWMHIILGDGTHERFRTRDFAAYYRMVRRRFEEAALASPLETYPLPCGHCRVCEWRVRCEAQRADDDHLSLVAGIRRSQIRRLEELGVKTMAQLAELPAPAAIKGVGPAAGEGLRLQAELQVHHRETGERRYVLLPPEGRHRGFALLPQPSAGDVFFDMEGDPWVEGRLEYLFGCVTFADDGGPRYRAFWAHSRVEEKRAFEAFVDFVTERRKRFPDLHVYHYAFYEPSAIKRLMGVHATREDEVDALLRDDVFVDLYTVVRQSLRVSEPRYSLKNLESFYMNARSEDITDAGTSVIAYERYLETHDPAIIESIRVYNEVDCRSTMMLCEWLRERAFEAAGTFPPYEPPSPPERAPSEDVLAADAERARVTAALLRDLPEVREDRSPEEQALWLVAQLLDWHRREDKPEWWAFFDRLGASPEELVDDADCIGDLTPEGEPEEQGRSLVHAMRFPPQETKLSSGDVYDPATLKRAGELLDVDGVEGVLRLKRGRSASQPLPRSLIPGGPYDNRAQRSALLRLGTDVLERGIDAPGRYRALRDLVLCEPPRLRGRERGAALVATGDPDTLRAAIEVARNLDGGTLFIQGPPGSGKTFTAARVIVALMRDGRKVGVASNSHKAINNLLAAVEEAAREAAFAFAGAKKAGSDGSGFDGDFIESVRDAGEIVARLEELSLVAGTAWLFARAELDQTLDVLFVDEAGQVSLANALAIGTAARNLVLVGDPMQLSQPTKGHHPQGTGVSVLEHLLGDHETVPPERGLFLAHSWRMHPGVCAFISDVMYEGRLVAHPGNERQAVEGIGSGLRFFAVDHDGNVQRSAEEAEWIRVAIDEMLGASFTPKDGTPRPLALDDFLVVTPYNAQVNCLRDALPDDARVGTVDKFQGQEAPVVFFSMASSSGEELPRTLDFLFSRNRLNVAVSRAQSLAILVASPRLLNVRCHTVEQMRMVNALCRFVEMASPA